MITGFARILKFKDTTGFGTLPTATVALYEGVFKNGEPNGFARVIDTEESTLFIGWLDGLYKTMKGPGVYVTDTVLRNSGVYKEGVSYKYADNHSFYSQGTFTDFGIVDQTANSGDCTGLEFTVNSDFSGDILFTAEAGNTGVLTSEQRTTMYFSNAKPGKCAG